MKAIPDGLLLEAPWLLTDVGSVGFHECVFLLPNSWASDVCGVLVGGQAAFCEALGLFVQWSGEFPGIWALLPLLRDLGFTVLVCWILNIFLNPSKS